MGERRSPPEMMCDMNAPRSAEPLEFDGSVSSDLIEQPDLPVEIIVESIRLTIFPLIR
jgi:hypothetical protein